MLEPSIEIILDHYRNLEFRPAPVPPDTRVLRVQAGLIREGTAVTLASEDAATKPANIPVTAPATGN